MYITIALVTFIICGVFCHYIAKNRGANPSFWGVMGIIFGPLALPFVFLSKPVNNP